MIKKINNYYTVENGKIIYEGALPGDAIICDNKDYHIAIVKKDGWVVKLWKYNEGQFRDTLSAINLSEQNPGKDVIFTKHSGMTYEGRNLLQGISIMRYNEIKKFNAENFDPKESTDEELAEDFKVLTTKYSKMKDGGETEFKNIDEVVKLTAKLLKEIYARGKQTFHPKNMKKSTIELLQHAGQKVVSAQLELENADLISAGQVKETEKINKMDLSGPFILVDSDGEQYGIIRFNEPIEKDEKFVYKMRDFIPFSEIQKRNDVNIISTKPEKPKQKDSKNENDNEIIEKQFKIIKRDDEKRLVYGIVYEPETKDTDNEEASAEEIEKACHEFMIDYAKVKGSHLDMMHEDALSLKDAVIVECFIQPIDMTLGQQLIYKGSWMLVTKIYNDELWEGIKDGIINGYSMGGTAQS